MISSFPGTTDYDLATIDAIAKALRWKAPEEYAANVLVDGLSKTKRTEYAREFRRLGLRIRVEELHTRLCEVAPNLLAAEAIEFRLCTALVRAQALKIDRARPSRHPSIRAILLPRDPRAAAATAGRRLASPREDSPSFC